MDRVRHARRRLKLRQLEILMAVAETGSMAKAAVRLAVTQPAISRAIAETNWKSPSIEVTSIALPKEVGFALQQILNILNLAALYAPLALAFALIYGLIRRIHMAFGQIAVIGGYGAIIGLVIAISMPALGLMASIGIVLALAGGLAALWGWLVGRAVVDAGEYVRVQVEQGRLQ